MRGIQRIPDAARGSIIRAVMKTYDPLIVVGYDGSGAARAAVAHAARRAGRTGKLVIVHASGPRAPVDERVHRELQLHQTVHDVLMIQVGDALREVTFELRLVPGSPARALASVAEEQDASEIVVGGGEVADELGETTRRQVVVVPYGAPIGSTSEGRPARR
jgi:Universal stress protein family